MINETITPIKEGVSTIGDSFNWAKALGITLLVFLFAYILIKKKLS